MNYNWKFEIPKETEENSPYIETKKLTYGRIKHVTISNPSGSVGKSHLRIFYHEWQLYPISNGEWYEGEKIHVSFEDNYLLFTQPYELKFKGYNTSILYTHGFYINIALMREETIGEIGEAPQLKGMEGEI